MTDLGEWDELGGEVDPVTGEIGGDQAAESAESAEVGTYFSSLDEFVAEMIVPVFRRGCGDRSPNRWAAEWWRYPEAVMRLEALWRAWEQLRLDPALGMSIWLRDHADPHMAVLLSEYGPFGRCRDDVSEHGDPLPYTAPPPGLYS